MTESRAWMRWGPYTELHMVPAFSVPSTSEGVASASASWYCDNTNPSGKRGPRLYARGSHHLRASERQEEFLVYKLPVWDVL